MWRQEKENQRNVTVYVLGSKWFLVYSVFDSAKPLAKDKNCY